MKQSPSRLKYKKNHKLSKSLLYLNEKKQFYPLNGFIALKSIENAKLTYNQIEACRKAIRRILKKKGMVYIRIFTNISVTKKPLSTRMGKGKGSHSHWIAIVKKGQVICELISDNYKKAYRALLEASSKLPIKVNITRNIY